MASKNGFKSTFDDHVYDSDGEGNAEGEKNIGVDHLQHGKAIGHSERNPKENDGNEIGEHLSLIDRRIRNTDVFPDDIFRLRSTKGHYLCISFEIDAAVAARKIVPHLRSKPTWVGGLNCISGLTTLEGYEDCCF